MSGSQRKAYRRRRSQKKILSFLQPCDDNIDRPFCCLSKYEYLTKYAMLLHATWPIVIPPDAQNIFLEKFARGKEDGGDFIYLRDIKEYTLFTVLNDISPTFVEFFWTMAVDRFLRALIIYFQYFLQVWYLVQYRTENRHKLFRHRNSVNREEKWRLGLNDLRYIVAREYFAIVDGHDDSSPHHHMGYDRKRLKSSVKTDKMIHELLIRYARRVVEITLCKNRDPAIYDEMSRLFQPSEIYRIKGFRNDISDIDLRCLEDPIMYRSVPVNAPIAQELYRPSRKPILRTLGHGPEFVIDSDDTQMQLLQMVYLCAESRLFECNIRVGILGLQRSQFDVMFSAVPETSKITSLDRFCDEAKESLTPPLYENLPQKCELSDLLYCECLKKDTINKWKRNVEAVNRIYSQPVGDRENNPSKVYKYI